MSGGGFTLDTGALLALERGDPRIRALLRRTQENGLALAVPAGVIAQSWRGGPRVVTSDPDDLHRVDPGLRLIVV